MKKSELKNIIKECVKEVIFEEGVLSGIITEVAQGLVSSPIQEQQLPKPKQTNSVKQKVLGAIGSKGYEDVKQKFSNPSLFEGTVPIAENKGHGALSGVSPGDSGVDISNMPGFSNWGNVAKNIKQRYYNLHNSDRQRVSRKYRKDGPPLFEESKKRRHCRRIPPKVSLH